jgi:hypothetical protein
MFVVIEGSGTFALPAIDSLREAISPSFRWRGIPASDHQHIGCAAQVPFNQHANRRRFASSYDGVARGGKFFEAIQRSRNSVDYWDSRDDCASSVRTIASTACARTSP